MNLPGEITEIRAGQPLDDSSLGRWSEAPGPEELECVIREASDLAARVGYDLSRSDLPALVRPGSPGDS